MGSVGLLGIGLAVFIALPEAQHAVSGFFTNLKQPVATLLTGILAVCAVLLAQWQFAVRQRKDHLELRDRQALDHEIELEKQRAEHDKDWEIKRQETFLIKKEQFLEKINLIQSGISLFTAEHINDLAGDNVRDNHNKFQETISTCVEIRKQVLIDSTLLIELLLLYFPAKNISDLSEKARNQFRSANSLYLEQMQTLQDRVDMYKRGELTSEKCSISENESQKFYASLDAAHNLYSTLSKNIREVDNKLIKPQ